MVAFGIGSIVTVADEWMSTARPATPFASIGTWSTQATHDRGGGKPCSVRTIAFARIRPDPGRRPPGVRRRLLTTDTTAKAGEQPGEGACGAAGERRPAAPMQPWTETGMNLHRPQGRTANPGDPTEPARARPRERPQDAARPPGRRRAQGLDRRARPSGESRRPHRRAL